MTLKGKVFKPEDAPRSIREGDADRCRAWCEAQTERNRIVAIEDGAPEGKKEIIAEELDQRILNRLSPKAKRIAGAMMNANLDVRLEVLAAFGDAGELENPFGMM